MKSISQVQEEVTQIAFDFGNSYLKSEQLIHVSQTFAAQFIAREFAKQYGQLRDRFGVNDIAVNIAYRSSIYLFETMLEYGCESGIHGHHAAQAFASKFENYSFENDTTN